jgi:hypothetical protein
VPVGLRLSRSNLNAALRPGAARRIYGAMRLLGLLRLLLLVALMVAPVGMLGRHAAMAAPQDAQLSASAGHCADMGGTSQQDDDHEAPLKSFDCMVACACTLPTSSPAVAAAFLSNLSQPQSLTALVSGHHPQSDPPPPRLS